MKITKMQFTNYKAFYGESPDEGPANKIATPKGENLLIYGENGSGKTSIYEGLKNLFLASDAVDGKPHFSRHLAVDEFIKDTGDESKQIRQAANIKITLDDFKGHTKQVIYGTPDGNVESDKDILEANKSNSFFSYRELLKTYLTGNDTEEDFRMKLGDLIVKDILAQTTMIIPRRVNMFENDWTNNTGTNKTHYQNYRELWGQAKYTRSSRFIMEDIANKFDIELKKDISEINMIINDLLQYFFQSLKIQLSLVDTYRDWDTRNYPVFQVALKCWHYGIDTGKNHESHLTILNEARLSALALCIFLSGIVIKSKQKTKIKFLFFDDIFIGLDTSNRIPLLKILNEYKVIEWKEGINAQTGLIENQIQKNEDGSIKYLPTPFFGDYQIFITTYDYHWFETAKFYLSKNKWQTVEMYSHYADDVNFNVPLILSPSLNYYEKAEIYFKKSKDYKDYPASANYLRKEFESQFKRLLYGKYLLKDGDKGTTLLREGLGELIDSFEQMIKEDLAFDYAPFTALLLYTKTTLNPLSHDNLSKPVFKRELQEAFVLADKLRDIIKELLIKKGDKVSVTTTNGGITRITNLELSADVFRFTIDRISKNTLVFLTPVNYLEGETKKSLTYLPECEIRKAFDMIYHDVFKIENSSKDKNVYKEFILEDGRSLADIFTPI